MARPSGEKTRCNGMWTEAKFSSFVKNQLRQATRKWAPISQCMKNASTRRGFKMCASCEREVPVSVIKTGKRGRQKNVFCDHIKPIVPVTGWVSWDHCIDSMFSELDNLQCLCGDCHDIKTAMETALRKKHRQENKSGG